MISKQYIKDLEFKDIYEFYNYVVDSKINGAYKQTKELINKMSREQRRDFLGFLVCEGHSEHIAEFNKMLI